MTEFSFAFAIGKMFHGNDSLSSTWSPTMGFLQSSDALVFIDNHDIQRGHGMGSKGIITHREPKLYIMATALMLAYDYGHPRIMSSYKYVSTDDGPPANDHEQILSPHELDYIFTRNCANGWICEHRWIEIANMVKFRNIVDRTNIYRFQEIGLKQIAFCRGNRGFIAINNDGINDIDKIMYVCVEPGKYCDVISGGDDLANCENVIEVDEDRNAQIHISINARNGVVAFHIDSKIM